MLVASISGSVTSFVGDHGVYAVFLLMAIDAVFPAASELVMVYAGALASGAFASQQVVLFGHEIEPGFGASVTMSLSGTLGYLAAGMGRPALPAHTLGYVYLPALLWIALATVLTAPLGAMVAHRMKVALLRKLFAALLIALATRMLWKLLV